MDDPIRKALADTTAFLRAHSVPFALIGGVAVSLRGEPRFTADVDLVVELDVDGALELLEATHDSPLEPLFPEAADVTRESLLLPLRHSTTGTTVDLAIGMSGFERDLIARADPVDTGGLVVPVATSEDLVLLKVIAARPRDIEDARQIVCRHGNQLDWEQVLAVGKQLQDAVGEDILSRIEDLRREPDVE